MTRYCKIICGLTAALGPWITLVSWAQGTGGTSILPEKFAIEDYKFTQAQSEFLITQLNLEEARGKATVDPSEKPTLTSRLKRSLDASPRLLANLLSSSDSGLVEFAVAGLALQFGPQASAYLPRLSQLLEDTSRDEHLATLTTKALSRIAPGSTNLVEPLKIRLRKTPASQAPLRAALLEALGNIGATAGSALPLIQTDVQNPSAEVQYQALTAWSRIAQTQLPTSTGWRSARDWKTLGLRPDQLPILFEHLASGQTNEVPGLVQILVTEAALPNAPKYLQCFAIEAVRVTGQIGPATLPFIFQSLANTDEFLKSLAARCLSQLDFSSPRFLPILAEALGHSNSVVRIQSALALRKLGPKGAMAAPNLGKVLLQTTEHTPENELGVYLETLKAMGPGGSPAAEALVTLLREQSPFFHNRNKWRLHHLRGYMLATLAEIGAPRTALPLILDGLANTEKSMPYVFAAAARAVATLGPDAKVAVPYLLRPLKGDLNEEFLSYDSLDSHLSATGEYTSGLIESIRALARIGAGAREAVPYLQSLVDKPGLPLNGSGRLQRIPDAQKEAVRAIRAISG